MATQKRTVEVALSTTGVDAQGRPQRVPLVTADDGSSVAVEAPPSVEPDLAGEHMLINIGPQHPATHGVLRLVLELDGETVVRCIPHVGYLHCGFEKIGEYRQYNQIIPWTDREDYLNSIGNNVAFALGAERLFGIEYRRRDARCCASWRWSCRGSSRTSSGSGPPASTSARSRRSCGRSRSARTCTTCSRAGWGRASRHRPRASAGMAADIPDGWLDGLRNFVRTFPKTIDEIDKMLTKNAIWVGRTVGLGIMTPEEAVNYGLSGPMVRASGVAYDVRKDFPYLDYETYDFDVPVGTNGDVYDRYLVRMEELRQSVRILAQAADRLPDGPVNVDDPRLILPPKTKATSEMESMIHHFKLVMEGPRPPLGEAYVAVESPKGEKGYYMVSDGTSKPVRWRIRPPSFVNLSAIPKMVEGHLLSDVIAINASIDIVMGEIDR